MAMRLLTTKGASRSFSAAAGGEFYPGISKIQYEGPSSKNPLAFKHYNADEVVAGKTMKEHLRFSAVCQYQYICDCVDFVCRATHTRLSRCRAFACLCVDAVVIRGTDISAALTHLLFAW